MNTDGIAGHERQIKILSRMIEKKSVPQAILFSGIPGIGKRELAMRFFGAFFCEDEKSPCMKCSVCRQFASGTYPDMIQLDPNEKGAIPIGDKDKREEGSVRWLIDCMSRKSLSGKYGVLINGIDRVSIEGEIALLKTIEEPQEGTCIIMIAENKPQILPTILSRSMDISFSPLTADEVEEVLKMNGTECSNYMLVSAASGGSMKYAEILSDDDTLKMLQDVCMDISGYIGEGLYLKLDLREIQKKIEMEDILIILTNIYRSLLLSKLNGKSTGGFFPEIDFGSTLKLKKLIKIFLALRKGFANNLNIRNSLKGLIYSIESIDEIGLPELDYS